MKKFVVIVVLVAVLLGIYRYDHTKRVKRILNEVNNYRIETMEVMKNNYEEEMAFKNRRTNFGGWE